MPLWYRGISWLSPGVWFYSETQHIPALHAHILSTSNSLSLWRSMIPSDPSQMTHVGCVRLSELLVQTQTVSGSFWSVLAVSRKVWTLVAIFRARNWTSSVRWMTGYPTAYQPWGDETSLDERLSGSLSFDFGNKHEWQAAPVTHTWPKIAEWRLRGWQRQKHASVSWNCWCLGLKSKILWTRWRLPPQVPGQAKIT